MPSRPVLTVEISGPAPSPEEVAARFVGLAARMGWLEESEGSPSAGEMGAHIGQANALRLPSLEGEASRHRGEVIPMK